MTISRDQALVNNLISQRETASNQAANLAADLDVARAELDVLRARVAELEAAPAVPAEPKAG